MVRGNRVPVPLGNRGINCDASPKVTDVKVSFGRAVPFKLRNFVYWEGGVHRVKTWVSGACFQFLTILKHCMGAAVSVVSWDMEPNVQYQTISRPKYPIKNGCYVYLKCFRYLDMENLCCF